MLSIIAVLENGAKRKSGHIPRTWPQAYDTRIIRIILFGVEREVTFPVAKLGPRVRAEFTNTPQQMNVRLSTEFFKRNAVFEKPLGAFDANLHVILIDASEHIACEFDIPYMRMNGTDYLFEGVGTQ